MGPDFGDCSDGRMALFSHTRCPLLSGMSESYEGIDTHNRTHTLSTTPLDRPNRDRSQSMKPVDFMPHLGGVWIG